MAEQSTPEPRPHMLSPSAWNRYETCPRMYWLSRQGLPRKAGMAASLGTAVHASVEDLLLHDISHIADAESEWLPEHAERILKVRWEEEKAIFDATPRRPQWKEDKWKDAIRNQRGAVMMLLDHVGVRSLEQERITGALWRRIQKLAIAVEGELKT
ncbi:MAG: PD-(D/E)XK nuclease family protein, partial [Candidatus Poseidoniaceae archaeon]